MHFDAFIGVGGDGSLEIAHRFSLLVMLVIGILKTIDNDLSGTLITFRVDTSCVTATEALDKLKNTAKSHERIFFIELMNRCAWWIAFESGLAGGADAIFIP